MISLTLITHGLEHQTYKRSLTCDLLISELAQLIFDKLSNFSILMQVIPQFVRQTHYIKQKNLSKLCLPDH